jgi:hypothetical protein
MPDEVLFLMDRPKYQFGAEIGAVRGRLDIGLQLGVKFPKVV